MSRRPLPTGSGGGGPRRAGLLLTGSVVMAAAFIHGTPGLAESLTWSRPQASLFTGLTAHLCHWTWDHLVWDVLTFVVLSCLVLRLRPSRYVPALLSAAVLIPLEIHLWQPQFDSYRGLSGLDCALFGLILTSLWRYPARQARWLAGGAGSLFLIKTLYEQLSGATLFVSSTPDLFLPAPSAHLTGLLCGLIAGSVKRPSTSKEGAALRSSSRPVPAEVA